MNRFFKNPRTVLQMHEAPLAPYIDSYAAEIRAEGYACGSARPQIRLIANFSRWMVKHRIAAQELTPEHFQSYLRSRARNRCNGRSDHATLNRLYETANAARNHSRNRLSHTSTPSARLQEEFRGYLLRERALASTTVAGYLRFVGEFLAECFGAGPVDLSCLRAGAADLDSYSTARHRLIVSG